MPWSWHASVPVQFKFAQLAVKNKKYISYKESFNPIFLKFLWDTDKEYKNKLIKALKTSLIPIPVIWFFDFSKLEPLINITLLNQTKIRLTLIILTWIIVSIISYLLVNLSFVKKYYNPEKLSKEEGEKIIEYHENNLRKYFKKTNS